MPYRIKVLTEQEMVCSRLDDLERETVRAHRRADVLLEKLREHEQAQGDVAEGLPSPWLERAALALGAVRLLFAGGSGALLVG